jgi:hypothetical protein
MIYPETRFEYIPDNEGRRTGRINEMPGIARVENWPGMM